MAATIELRVEELVDELVIDVEAPELFGEAPHDVRASVEDGVLTVRVTLAQPHVGGGLHPAASGV